VDQTDIDHIRDREESTFLKNNAYKSEIFSREAGEVAEVEFAGLVNDGLHQYGLTLRCLEYILLTVSVLL